MYRIDCVYRMYLWLTSLLFKLFSITADFMFSPSFRPHLLAVTQIGTFARSNKQNNALFAVPMRNNKYLQFPIINNISLINPKHPSSVSPVLIVCFLLVSSPGDYLRFRPFSATKWPINLSDLRYLCSLIILFRQNLPYPSKS